MTRRQDTDPAASAGGEAIFPMILAAQSGMEIVMDVAMPELNGIEAARRITGAYCPRTSKVAVPGWRTFSYTFSHCL